MPRIQQVIGIGLIAVMFVARMPTNRPPQLFAFAATAWPPPAAQVYATFYVSTSGSDSDPGTERAPFQTLERSRTAVRSITAAMTGDIVVYLKNGLYVLPDTVTFGAGDSGLNGFRVFYAADPGARPVLSGGQRITGWIPAGQGLYRAPVGALRFRQLYVNGSRAVRARTPDAGSYYRVRAWDTPSRRVEVSRHEVNDWQRQNQIEMVILGKGVNQSNLRIASIGPFGTSALHAFPAAWDAHRGELRPRHRADGRAGRIQHQRHLPG
jgi:hypothetical protein